MSIFSAPSLPALPAPPPPPPFPQVFANAQTQSLPQAQAAAAAVGGGFGGTDLSQTIGGSVGAGTKVGANPLAGVSPNRTAGKELLGA